MTIEELEKRLAIAQTAMVYIRNILAKNEQEFLSEKVHLYSRTIEVEMCVTDRKNIFITLFELHWYMEVLDFDSKESDGKRICWFVVKIPEKLENAAQ